MKTVINKILEHRVKLLIVGLIIMFALFVKECRNNNYLEYKSKQNEAFYNEEIKRQKTKDGRIESEKAVMIKTINELKNDTSELAKEVIKIKKEGAKPKVVFVTKIEYIDSGSVNNIITKIDTNKYSINFDYESSDKIISIKGRNYFFAEGVLNNQNKIDLKLNSDKTYLDSIKIDLDITFGIKEEDGIDRIFAKTKSDKVVFKKLDAVEVEDYFKNKYSEKTKKRITIGPYVGFGITVGQKGVNYGPTLGIGIQYSLIRF